MNITITTDGIVIAPPVPLSGGGYRLAFTSPHTGMFHQLYLNGRLEAWTDLPAQREFLLDDDRRPARLLIAAVDELSRETDLAALLPADIIPPWVYRPRIVRSCDFRPGDVVEILDDHATGELSPVPLAREEAWPAYLPRWGFGQDYFAVGGFGYDGSAALGMGLGAFGLGMFGFDADLLDLQAILEEPGRHRVVVRIRRQSGVSELSSAIVDVP